MIKNIIIGTFVFFLISSCNTSLKLMQNGAYDAAIQNSVSKLHGKKHKEKEIIVLEEAYLKANNRDSEKIAYLKKEGSPDSWNDVYLIYSQMNKRQEIIKPLLPLHLTNQNRDAKFDIINYDSEIISAKKNAAEYLYTHALSILDKKNKTEARNAYNELIKVKDLFNNYRDVDAELNRARNLGTSYVLFKMENTTGVPLPPSFEEELTKISLAELEGDWLKYHTRRIKELTYDYTILVNMKNIDVSPEAIKEINYTESKVIPDGFQYVLDAHGNVKKDSSGNDIKVPKTKTISCNVSENYQNKKAIIAGSLDYIDNSTNQLLKTNPIASENFFEYRSAIAIGDITALKPETKEKIGRRPVPFPSGFDMLLKAGETLKGMVKNIVYSNKAIFY